MGGEWGGGLVVVLVSLDDLPPLSIAGSCRSLLFGLLLGYLRFVFRRCTW